MLSDLEKRLYSRDKLRGIPKNIYKAFKSALKKENLDLAIVWGSLTSYLVATEFFGFSHSIPHSDKIAHFGYGYVLPRTGDHMYANFSEKYERAKGIASGIVSWLIGTFGKEAYDSLVGKNMDPYDILASALMFTPALVVIWRKRRNKKVNSVKLAELELN